MTELEIYRNFQMTIANRIPLTQLEFYLPNVGNEVIIDNDLSNVNQLNRINLNSKCEKQYFDEKNTLLKSNSYKFSNSIEILFDSIHFPKKILIPNDIFKHDGVEYFGFINELQMDELKSLIAFLFEDNQTTTTVGSKIEKTHINLVDRYLYYRNWFKNKKPIDNPNRYLAWQNSCKTQGDRYFEIVNQIKIRNSEIKQLISNIYKPEKRNFDINSNVSFLLNKDSSFVLNYIPNTIDSFKKIFEISALVNSLKEFQYKKAEEGQKLYISSFELDSITLTVNLYSIERPWVPNLNLFLNFLKSDIWCLKKNNFQYFGKKKVNENNDDDLLKSVITKLIIANTITINLKQTDSNFQLFENLSNDERQNLLICNFSTNIYKDEANKLKVKIIQNSMTDNFLLGFVSQQIPICPNTNTTDFEWDSDSFI